MRMTIQHEKTQMCYESIRISCCVRAMAHLAQCSASSVIVGGVTQGKHTNLAIFCEPLPLMPASIANVLEKYFLSWPFFDSVCGLAFMNLSKACLNLLVISPSAISSESRLRKFSICCTAVFNLYFKSLLKQFLSELAFFLLLQDLVNTVLPSPRPSQSKAHSMNSSGTHQGYHQPEK